jgi:opacity protein-like surface antigen
MKKITTNVVLAVAGLTVAAPTVDAQTADGFSRHEITAGTGVLTTDQIMAVTFDALITLVSYVSYTELDGKQYSAPFAVGYKYRFNRVISLGGTFSHMSSHGDCKFLWTQGEPESIGTVRYSYNLFAAEMDLRYLTRRYVSLYSTLGFGFTAGSRKVTPTTDAQRETTRMPFFWPNFQVTALGLKVGHNNFGGYLDVGAGYKGVFAAGLYGRF